MRNQLWVLAFVPVAFAPEHADRAVFLERPYEKLYVLDLT
jgi:hypothetical protein